MRVFSVFHALLLSPFAANSPCGLKQRRSVAHQRLQNDENIAINTHTSISSSRLPKIFLSFRAFVPARRERRIFAFTRNRSAIAHGYRIHQKSAVLPHVFSHQKGILRYRIPCLPMFLYFFCFLSCFLSSLSSSFSACFIMCCSKDAKSFSAHA